jgi:hypothetical protein
MIRQTHCQIKKLKLPTIKLQIKILKKLIFVKHLRRKFKSHRKNKPERKPPYMFGVGSIIQMLLSEKQLEGRKGVRKERQRKITDQYHEY